MPASSLTSWSPSVQIDALPVPPVFTMPALSPTASLGLTVALPIPVPAIVHRCVVCRKVFTTSVKLAQHSAVHTLGGNRTVHCCPTPGCGKRCVRYQDLVDHFRLHVPGMRLRESTSFVCMSMRQVNMYVYGDTDLHQSPLHTAIAGFQSPSVSSPPLPRKIASSPYLKIVRKAIKRSRPCFDRNRLSSTRH